MIARLRQHAERTSTGSARLLRGARDKPSGLKASTIDNWLYGHAESAKQEYLSFVLALWEKLPTDRRVPLTAEMSAMLNAEMIRTGTGPVAVLRDTRDCPDALTYQIVSAWAAQTTDTVRGEHWNYLIALLHNLPDAVRPTRSHRIQRSMRRGIADTELAEIRTHRDRTGIGGAILLRTAADRPSGLTPTMISAWLSGASKTANPDHIAYVLARYRAWP